MRRRCDILYRLAACAAVMLVCARPSRAQEAVNFGSVAGRVTDGTGAVLRAAEVVARHLATNAVTTVVTDAEGRFRFSYLRVGMYDFMFRAPGFAPGSTQLTVTAGGAFDVPVVLEVAGVESAVVVTAGAAVLEAARTQLAATISSTEAAVLPMNGRNALDLALLVPGVSPTNVGGGTQVFAETSAVPGVGISVGSQRNLSNNFMVDGLSANDDAAALAGIVYGVDAIDQLQVITSGGQAEMGRALGGYVNIVTRSGTNLASGSAYGFFRDDRLNASNPLLHASAAALTRGKLPMSQRQFGATIAGPLRRDRTFLFLNAEQRLLDQSGLVTIPSSTVEAINSRLVRVGYAGPPVSTGIYANPVDTTTVLARVDHDVSAHDRMSVRYSAYRVSSLNARGAGGIATASASAGVDNTDQTIAVSNVRLIGRTILESRGQVAYSRLAAPPSDPVGPAVTIAGVASFGTLSTSPTERTTTLYQAVTNVSHQRGAHAMRVGVDLLYNDVTIAYPRSRRGSYSFSSLANFLTGTYTSAGFTQTFGESVVSQTNPNVGLYVQDEWHVRSGLTLNVGARYDLQFLDTVETDTDNVSPRAGLVWAPSESRRWIVRANAGRFYDRVPLRALANALLSAGNTTDLSALRQLSIVLAPAQTGAPEFPNVLAGIVPASTLVSVTTMDHHLQNAYSDQTSVEVERQVGHSATVGVGYEHLRGRRLIMSINQNVPACAISGSNNGCRPNSTYANNNQYSSVGASDYNGLHLSFVQRPAAWGMYRLSYSLSKAMNNLGEAFFSSPIDPGDITKDWGRSDDDQRHRLTALVSVQVPHASGARGARRMLAGMQFSVMSQYYSALPYNITTGATSLQGTPARPTVAGSFIVRNAGQGSAFSTTNLRVSRSLALGPRLRVEGLVEIFNLFNRRNDVARNTVFGTGAYPDSPAPNFGEVTVLGEPRSAQVGVRVKF